MDFKNAYWDVFVCHASEDKESIAQPLVEFLLQLGLRVWYDSNLISTTDGINDKIHEGLKNTKVGVVILSSSFFEKVPAIMELGVLNFKRNEGVGVLHLLYYEIDRENLKKKIPPHLGDIRSQ